jgi:hypothetical protein
MALVSPANDIEIVAIPTQTPVSAAFGSGGCVAVGRAAVGGVAVGGKIEVALTVGTADQSAPARSGDACMT